MLNTDKSNPFDKTILLAVTVKMLGVSRKVDTSEVEVETDKDLLRVSKKILACEEYDAVKKTVVEMKKFLRSRVVPGVKFVKGGIFPVPSSFIEEVDGRLQEFISAYKSGVAAFIDVYEQRRDESIARLADLGDISDYPAVAIVRRSFSISVDYVTIGPPQSLASISRELFDRENEKIKVKFQEAAGQVQDAMRQMFGDLVDHMVERLQPGEDGKKKSFRESMVGNFCEFLDTFKDKNITNDKELADLVAKARGVLEGRSVDSLRKNDDVRAIVGERMAEIKGALGKLVGDRQGRSIIIEDAEDESQSEEV